MENDTSAVILFSSSFFFFRVLFLNQKPGGREQASKQTGGSARGFNHRRLVNDVRWLWSGLGQDETARSAPTLRVPRRRARRRPP